MLTNKHNWKTIAFLGLLLFSFCGNVFAQEKESKTTKEAKLFMAEAEEALANNDFATAEAKYREAIAKNPELADASYNLGNLYYNKNIVGESAERLQNSANVSKVKDLKHKAYHNQGNAFMAQKNYQKAVEAYKNALRNRPSDDQTRYNLAVAKEKLEKEKQNQKDDKNKDKDQKDNKDQQNKDKQNKDGKQDKKNNKDDSDKKNKEDKPSDKKDEIGKKDKKEDEDKQDKKQQNPEQEKGDKNKSKQQPQPKKGQLSPQQMKNLLEAMENQEKKIQDKINAKKAKGQKRNAEKDW